MAEYLILIYEDENSYATATPDVFQQVMEAHNRFAQQVGEKGGKLVAGNALQPTSTATTIRSDVVTDGPFVETKEVVGGFAILEAKSKEEAIALTKRFLAVHADEWDVECELRPLEGPEFGRS